jgi:uncharacterized membrane protein YfcA
VPPLPTVLLLLGAGFAAGLSGSMAGLASLFSYPALLAVGLAPLAANVTNTVALTATSVGAGAASRAELVGQGPTLRRLAPVVLLGGAAGAGLLLLTPPGAFEAVVPALIAGASVTLLLQPRIRRSAERRRIRRDARPSPLLLAGTFGVAVYGGYFGAAAGVLLLALLLVGLPLSLLPANAVKNVLLGLANAVAAVAFVLVGPVDWAAVAPLAVGLLAGSWLGPAVARRLPATALRIGIGIAGLGLAAALATGLL